MVLPYNEGSFLSRLNESSCMEQQIYSRPRKIHISTLNKVGDLVSKDHIFLKSTKILGAKLTLSQRFVLMGKVDTIPSEWRNITKENTYSEPFQLNEDCFQLPVMGEMVDQLSTSSKMVHNEFKSHKASPLQLKSEQKINIQTLHLTGRKFIC